MIKDLFLTVSLIMMVFGGVSCTAIRNHFSSSNDSKEQIIFNATNENSGDAICKKTLDNALAVFDKDIPLIGDDLGGIVNLLSQYQSCEVVKRDDRIAEVLLKMLNRIQKLEAEVDDLKAFSIAPNP